MNLSSFIWSVADLLRGKYKPHEYGRVILPFIGLSAIREAERFSFDLCFLGAWRRFRISWNWCVPDGRC
jgi:HsdM N-terminal domain